MGVKLSATPLLPFEPEGGGRESVGDVDAFCGEDEGVDGFLQAGL